MPIQTILVDDSYSYIEAVRSYIATQPWIEIVGCALSGLDALELAVITHPDLVLIDWAMPEMDGLETTRRLKLLEKAPRVVILTMHENSFYRAAADNAGADGFIYKSEVGVKLFPVIRSLFFR